MPMVPSPMTPTFIRSSPVAEALDRGDQGAADARLQRRMPGIRHDGQARRRPGGGQFERGARPGRSCRSGPARSPPGCGRCGACCPADPRAAGTGCWRNNTPRSAPAPARCGPARRNSPSPGSAAACCTSPRRPTRRAPPAGAPPGRDRSGGEDSCPAGRRARPPAGSWRTRRARREKPLSRPCRNQSTSAGRPRNTPRSTQPVTRSGWACA